MKITVEAVPNLVSGNNGAIISNDIYLDDNFEGCLGWFGKLELEAASGEHELTFKGVKDENNIRFTATEDVYFWVISKFKIINNQLEIEYKGKYIRILE